MGSNEEEQQNLNVPEQNKDIECKTPQNEFIDLEKHLTNESNKKVKLEVDESKGCTFEKSPKSSDQLDTKIEEQKAESNIQTTKEEPDTKDGKPEDEANANPMPKRKRKKKNKKKQEEQNANDIANDIE